MGFVSFEYYLGLLIPFLPFAVIPALGAVFAVYRYKWLMGLTVAEASFTSKKQLAFSYIVFAAGMAIITNKCYYSPMQYDCWMECHSLTAEPQLYRDKIRHHSIRYILRGNEDAPKP